MISPKPELGLELTTLRVQLYSYKVHSQAHVR